MTDYEMEKLATLIAAHVQAVMALHGQAISHSVTLSQISQHTTREKDPDAPPRKAHKGWPKGKKRGPRVRRT